MSKISSGEAVAGSASPSRLPVEAGTKRRPRVPPAVDGIQSNTCRNSACSNFGVEPLVHLPQGRQKKGEEVKDAYVVIGHNKIKGQSRLRCKKCGEHISLKSNFGIKEELDRIG